MKQFIKNGKIYNSPVIITINGRAIYSNSQLYLKKFGYELYIPQIKKLSLKEQIQKSDKEINAKTDQKILNDFTYLGEEFYLTQENQINFCNMYIAREALEYPQTIKTKAGFMQLNNETQVEEFYLSGIKFVKDCLEEGWTEKLSKAAQLSANFEQN